MRFGEIAFVPSAIAPMFANTMGQMTLSIAVLSLVSMVVYASVASFPPYLTDDDEKLKGINGAIESAGNLVVRRVSNASTESAPGPGGQGARSRAYREYVSDEQRSHRGCRGARMRRNLRDVPLAFVAGPAIGALIVKFGAIGQIFLFDAITSLVAAAFILKVKVRDLVPRDDLDSERKPKPSAIREIKEGFAFSYSKRTIRLFITTSTATRVPQHGGGLHPR